MSRISPFPRWLVGKAPRTAWNGLMGLFQCLLRSDAHAHPLPLPPPRHAFGADDVFVSQPLKQFKKESFLVPARTSQLKVSLQLVDLRYGKCECVKHLFRQPSRGWRRWGRFSNRDQLLKSTVTAKMGLFLQRRGSNLHHLTMTLYKISDRSINGILVNKFISRNLCLLQTQIKS